MIIVEAQPEPAVSSDAASTNTLVTDELQKLPNHFIKLVYSSLVLSLLSFIFVLISCVSNYPLLMVPTILAFLFTLPHHGASILLWWLQRHQTESIFPFTPLTPRALAYSIFLVLTWIGSTAASAVSLDNSRHSFYAVYCVIGGGSAPGDVTINSNFEQPQYCTTIPPGFTSYWPSFVSTLMSALELIVITSITVLCWLHRPRKTLSTPSSSRSSPSITPETKIISA